MGIIKSYTKRRYPYVPRQTRYDEEFKRTLVDLYHNGKTQSSLCKEYGVSLTALSRWINQYSIVETDYDKSIGAYKIRRVLERDYGIAVSVGRVYRLMATMALPKMSTAPTIMTIGLV